MCCYHIAWHICVSFFCCCNLMKNTESRERKCPFRKWIFPIKYHITHLCSKNFESSHWMEQHTHMHSSRNDNENTLFRYQRLQSTIFAQFTPPFSQTTDGARWRQYILPLFTKQHIHKQFHINGRTININTDQQTHLPFGSYVCVLWMN